VWVLLIQPEKKQRTPTKLEPGSATRSPLGEERGIGSKNQKIQKRKNDPAGPLERGVGKGDENRQRKKREERLKKGQKHSF